MWAMGDWIAKNPEAVSASARRSPRPTCSCTTRPTPTSPRQLLGTHISADLSEQARAGYVQGALTVLAADFSRADLERWIAIDFKGGVITQRMPVADVFADGTPESPQAVKDLTSLTSRSCAAIEARDVRFKVPDGPDVLAGIDLTINDGEFVVIVGPSGCGKTTFLNMVAGLQGFTSGHLRVAGAAPQAGRRETAYALARDALLPWRDALGNVELALQIRGLAPEERRRRATEALARVGLADAATRHPAQLSQGMRQRVALARTFVTEPRLLILDEPFAALDAQTRIRMQELLLALLRQFSGTMIMVTHDIAEAIILADRVVVFSQRPATVTANYEVKLGNRQRKTSELRTDPEFSRLFERIWQDIEQEFSEREFVA